MPQRFIFDSAILNSVVGGHSAIEIPKLNIHSIEAATAFLTSYGFDIHKENDLEKIWYYHRRALVLMFEKLGLKEADLPEPCAIANSFRTFASS